MVGRYSSSCDSFYVGGGGIFIFNLKFYCKLDVLTRPRISSEI